MLYSDAADKDIVAFKTIEGDWFTGILDVCRGAWGIQLIVPIKPQWWEDGDKKHYFEEDVLEIKFLER